MGTQIQIDDTEMKKQLKKLNVIPEKTPTAIYRALNKTANGMKTDAGKEVTSVYVVKQKDVKATINLVKANSANLSITMSSQGRPINLIKFKYKKNKKPGRKGSPTVYAQVRKDRGGGYTGGFLATMRNGHTGAFVRKGTRAYPIKQLYGPGVAQMLNDNTIRANIQTKGSERFLKNLDHEVNWLLKQVES